MHDNTFHQHANYNEAMGVALANLAEIAYMNQIHKDMYMDKKKHWNLVHGPKLKLTARTIKLTNSSECNH